MSTTDEVRAHYDRFPYPTVVNLAIPQPLDHRRRRLSYLLGRREGDAIPRDAKIWVAGCGTQQATHWGLTCPDAQITATDLSEGVVTKAKGLATAMGVTNVTFETHDLMTSPPERDAFDLVVSTGVIHHLPSPEIGLSHLREGLKPTGALQLMVYGTAQRSPLAAIRRATATMADPSMSQDQRYALAIHILRTTLAAEDTCAPVGKAALQMLAGMADDQSFVADALLHPLEQTYDIDGLLALLGSAGFRHQQWYQPSLWRLDSYLEDPQLVARSHALPPEDQWRVVYELAGLSAPLLEVLAVPADIPKPAPYTADERAGMRLQACTGARVVAIKDSTPVGEIDVASFEPDGETIVGRPSAGYGSPRAWRLPSYVTPLLEACDGTATAAEIAARFDDTFGAQAVLDLMGTLLPDDIGLLTPAW